MEVIPVINCPDVQSASDRLRVAKQFAQWVHLDVSDARFTFNRSWGDPQMWKTLNPGVKLEAHLMVEEPEKVVRDWLEAGAKRIIVHFEALADPAFRFTQVDPKHVAEDIMAACEEFGAELMLALSPETKVEKARPYLHAFTQFQILAVYAGPSGQRFLSFVTDKIALLRNEVPHARIEVDGGIDPETTRRVKEAGADVVASGTYIFGSSDPKKAYEELTAI